MTYSEASSSFLCPPLSSPPFPSHLLERREKAQNHRSLWGLGILYDTGTVSVTTGSRARLGLGDKHGQMRVVGG